jgi:anti-anti-sigma regulatory factor
VSWYGYAGNCCNSWETGPAALIVALDQVPFMDATGLRALAEAHR